MNTIEIGIMVALFWIFLNILICFQRVQEAAETAALNAMSGRRK